MWTAKVENMRMLMPCFFLCFVSIEGVDIATQALLGYLSIGTEVGSSKCLRLRMQFTEKLSRRI